MRYLCLLNSSIHKITALLLVLSLMFTSISYGQDENRDRPTPSWMPGVVIASSVFSIITSAAPMVQFITTCKRRGTEAHGVSVGAAAVDGSNNAALLVVLIVQAYYLAPDMLNWQTLTPLAVALGSQITVITQTLIYRCLLRRQENKPLLPH